MRSGGAGRPARLAAALRQTGRRAVRHARQHDVVLYAAGTTLYAAFALVPLLALASRLTSLVVGADDLRSLTDRTAVLLPGPAGQGLRAVVAHSATLGWGPSVVSLVPASLYGEGLVRALVRLQGRDVRGPRALRGRAVTLALVVLSPLLLLGCLEAAAGLRDLLGTGTGARLLGVYLGFLVAWVGVSSVLVGVFRLLVPVPPPRRTLVWGASSTGSVVAGTALGYVLFLRLADGLHLGTVYAGSQDLALAVVGVGWVLVLHVELLVGYLLTAELPEHPLAAPA